MPFHMTVEYIMENFNQNISLEQINTQRGAFLPYMQFTGKVIFETKNQRKYNRDVKNRNFISKSTSKYN